MGTRKTRFVAGIACVLVAALFYAIEKDQTTVPVAIVFTVVGAVLVASAKHRP